MRLAFGAREIYESGRLVVALPYDQFVCGELNRLAAHTHASVADRSETLGLALIEIDDPDAVPDKLLAHYPDVAKDESYTRSPNAIDRILALLRHHFAELLEGYVPDMGKNRVAQVRGEPYLDGGGDGDPTAADGAGWDLHPAEVGEGISVGVFDTQLDDAHPYFANKTVATRPRDRLRPTGEPPKHTEGHATMIAGLILRQAPGAGVTVRQILDAGASVNSWTLAKELAEFAWMKPDLLNLSLGELHTDDGRKPLIFDAIVRMFPDTLIVAAGGNHGNVDAEKMPDLPKGLSRGAPTWPAAMPEVISVGSLTDDGELAPFTPKIYPEGPERPAQAPPWLRYGLPGVNVRGPYLRGEVSIERRDPHGNLLRDLKDGDGNPIPNPEARQFPEGFAKWSGASFATATLTGMIARTMAASGLKGRAGALTALGKLVAEGSVRKLNA
ncbi:S8 family peptidase [Nonomuraea candida]|uniref:S8 family peptidase n=1 Tax=Nonomuraea candida TaxID=359159 RepID=UPI0005BB0E63|nr:S8 family serine peptidase [Nonomuraea candida]